jgi:hypothetical protein
MHGGLSTGAKTQEGKNKSREAARRGMLAYWAKKENLFPNMRVRHGVHIKLTVSIFIPPSCKATTFLIARQACIGSRLTARQWKDLRSKHAV